MTINFNNIPSGILAPFMGIEFKSSGSNFPSQAYCLLVGQKLSTGSVANRSVTIVGEKQEDVLFGRGSMCARMVKAFKRNYPTATPYVYALSDPSGDKASSTLEVTTATATVSETLQIKVAGRIIYVPVIVGQSSTTIRTNILNAINADLDNACEAVTASGSTLTIRHRHVGTAGNGILIEKVGTPTLGFTLANLASGTGDIVLTGQEADIPENVFFNLIASPYSDSTNLTFYKSLMSNVNGRWAYRQDAYGHVVTIFSDNLSNTTSNVLKNDEHTTVLSIPSASSHTPLSEVVAGAVGVLHFNLETPPNLSNALTGRKILGVDLKSTFAFADRNALYAYGYSPLRLNINNEAEFDRVVTTYLTDDTNTADKTYKDINILFQLMYGARYYRNRMQATFGNTFINNIVLETMRVVAGDILRELEALSVFENVEQAIKDMILERNALESTRIDVKFTPEHVNPLLQIATQIESKI